MIKIHYINIGTVKEQRIKRVIQINRIIDERVAIAIDTNEAKKNIRIYI